jgi:hypothetical protein
MKRSRPRKRLSKNVAIYDNVVWLEIDHQHFPLRPYADSDDPPSVKRDTADNQARQLDIAIRRLTGKGEP